MGFKRLRDSFELGDLITVLVTVWFGHCVWYCPYRRYRGLYSSTGVIPILLRTVSYVTWSKSIILNVQFNSFNSMTCNARFHLLTGILNYTVPLEEVKFFWTDDWWCLSPVKSFVCRLCACALKFKRSILLPLLNTQFTVVNLQAESTSYVSSVIHISAICFRCPSVFHLWYPSFRFM